MGVNANRRAELRWPRGAQARVHYASSARSTKGRHGAPRLAAKPPWFTAVPLNLASASMARGGV